MWAWTCLLVKSTQFSARQKSDEKILVEGTVPEFCVEAAELSHAFVARTGCFASIRTAAAPLLFQQTHSAGCAQMLPGQVDSALGRSAVGQKISF